MVTDGAGNVQHLDFNNENYTSNQECHEYHHIYHLRQIRS